MPEKGKRIQFVLYQMSCSIRIKCCNRNTGNYNLQSFITSIKRNHCPLVSPPFSHTQEKEKMRAIALPDSQIANKTQHWLGEGAEFCKLGAKHPPLPSLVTFSYFM